MATSFDKSGSSSNPKKPKKGGKGSTANLSRRQVADEVRRAQARAERGQNFVIVGACVLVALALVGFAAYKPLKNMWDLRQFNGIALGEIGQPASVCGTEITKHANGTQNHVPAGTDVDYPDVPPAFGPHYDTPDGMERKLYTEADRPQIETLIHNSEHGYTILWYDQSIADNPEQMTTLRGIADRLSGTSNMRLKFKAIPWLSTDEGGNKPFPSGKDAGLPDGTAAHIALTHWTGGDGDVNAQQGVWQYCSDISGSALDAFMVKYPYFDSPEPNAM